MAVEHRRLGKHGVLVSNLCLGTMNFGPHTTVADSFAIMDRALELGINFFDTADVYGGQGNRGRTEEIIGDWFAQGGGRRDAVVLATKVFNPVDRSEFLPEPNRDLPQPLGLQDPQALRRAACRACAPTGSISIRCIMSIAIVPWDETWQAFNALVQQGKVVYVGSSNFAGWDIATACQEADRRGLTGLVSEQSIYHLDNRAVELEVIPACRHYGLGLIPWSPLAGGLLGGALEKVTTGRRSNPSMIARVEAKRAQLEAYEGLCREIGSPPGEVALAWLLHNPAVSAPIIGPRTMEQLESAVRATDIELDVSTLARLDEIFPGPGGEAPKAYAW